MTRFSGQVALVTGAGSGIGAAVVRRLAAEGARVVLVDQRAETAQALARELGDQACVAVADVRQEPPLAQAVQLAVQRFGRLDVSVHAAGFGVGAPIVDLTLAQWQAVIDVDLGGVFLATKHAARQMLRQGGGGAIVNIASTNAMQPGEGLAAYCAAKAGVAMFTQVAGLELAPHGIRVNGVGPGLTRTPLTQGLLASAEQRQGWLENIPAGRAAEPEEIAGLVAWLASPEAAYMSGETVYMDGGLRQRAYPGLARRRPGGQDGPAFLDSLREGGGA